MTNTQIATIHDIRDFLMGVNMGQRLGSVLKDEKHKLLPNGQVEYSVTAAFDENRKSILDCHYVVRIGKRGGMTQYAPRLGKFVRRRRCHDLVPN